MLVQDKHALVMRSEIDRWLEAVQDNITYIMETMIKNEEETDLDLKKQQNELVLEKIKKQYNLINIIIKIKQKKAVVKGVNPHTIKKLLKENKEKDK